MPILIGRDRVGEDLQREHGHGIGRVEFHELAAEGGEQQRRGFAGDARERKQAPVMIPGRAAGTTMCMVAA